MHCIGTRLALLPYKEAGEMVNKFLSFEPKSRFESDFYWQYGFEQTM
jgi:hypothetical protein